MNIEIDDNLFYDLKDKFMIKFLQDDLKTIELSQQWQWHKDDKKMDKKLMKAYKLILEYYGVDNG